MVDYHEEMNSECFKQWFIRLLNLLEEPSYIVMDNAPYHSVVWNKIPSSNSTKSEIITWLAKNEIQASINETKAELLGKLMPFKDKEKMYELDILAAQHGHTVIRLPPYHCQYKPIELLWAKVKEEIAKKIQLLSYPMSKNWCIMH